MRRRGVSVAGTRKSVSASRASVPVAHVQGPLVMPSPVALVVQSRSLALGPVRNPVQSRSLEPVLVLRVPAIQSLARNATARRSATAAETRRIARASRRSVLAPRARNPRRLKQAESRRFDFAGWTSYKSVVLCTKMLTLLQLTSLHTMSLPPRLSQLIVRRSSLWSPVLSSRWFIV